MDPIDAPHSLHQLLRERRLSRLYVAAVSSAGAALIPAAASSKTIRKIFRSRQQLINKLLVPA